jgi:hypothetical protein
MKCFLLLILTLLLCSIHCLAQYPTSMNGFVVGATSGINFYDGSSTIAMEIPPWTIAGGWHTYLMHNGVRTVTYSVPDAMVPNTSIDCTGKGPHFAVGPDASQPWKRSYSGIYSAHALVHPTEGPINIGFCHNENKNECGGAVNTIDPQVPIDCARPYQGYFAMVSGVWTTNTASNDWGQGGYNNDLGPILWPSSGYVASDGVSPASQGLLQPSSIISGGYIYVYVVDDGPLAAGPQHQEGRGRGIKLVRVPVTGCLDPTQYEVYYRNPSGDAQWLPSLPAGFTKENMLQYVGVQGPKSTDILSDEAHDNTWAYRFTAAQVNNTNYFIGCEEYVDNNDVRYTDGVGHARHHVALRFSVDLINWSPRELVVETSDDWDASTFNYPILLSSDGWTNTAVDLNNFYIVGTHSQSPFENLIFMMNIKNAAPAPSLFNAVTSLTPPVSAVLRQISGIYPNPTHGDLQLKYSLSESATVQITVLDMMGRRLQGGISTQRTAGDYDDQIDVSALATGTYMVELRVNDQAYTYKAVRE